MPKYRLFLLLIVLFISCRVFAQSLTDITNLDGVVSAQYYDSPAGEGYENLIDKNAATKYLTFNAQGWIQFDAPSSYVVTQYSITSANDFDVRDPMNWTLSGSNDNNNWTILDTQSNQNFINRLQERTFSFNNSAGYSYYRLNMTNHSTNILQLSEWKIFGVPANGKADLVDITNFGGTVSAQYTDNSQNVQNIIDNLKSTKYFTQHNSGWVKYKSDYPNLYVVSKYTITSADNGPEFDPKDWTLEGSNDNLTWSVLDTRTNQSFASRNMEQKYTFTNSDQYKYFRLNITANNGGASLQFAELKLYGLKGQGGNYPNADFSVNTNTIVLGDSVTFQNLSQNAVSYKWAFPGGTPSISTDVNPVVKYDSSGTYDVTLSVSDGTNQDNITYSGYITVEAIDKVVIANEIKQEFKLCWDSYVKYAWGYDELSPLNKTGSNWYSSSFLMTPVDALDTMILMGLKTEADSARQLIDTKLNFNQSISVSNFEFTIRFIGGLLSSYQLTGDSKLLSLAKDLADRGITTFKKSPTGMPYGDINLKTGAVGRPDTNPAEVGTMLMEYGTLSHLTGDTSYYNTAKRALLKLYSLRSGINLVGSGINIETGKWNSTDCSVSGGIDSYFEYLKKCAVLFGDNDCANMWNSTITSINKYMYDSISTGVWYGHVDMNSGKLTSRQFGSLDAFFAALLALDGEAQHAAALEESCYKMWNVYGIEPEQLDYSKMTATSAGYYLRPEIIESAYYLYHYTKDPRYLIMGKKFFDDLKKYCRTDNGYVQLNSVVTHEQTDGMPSYFLAETMKYLYLLFAPPETLNFDSVIFNTEAHPLHRVATAVDTTASVPGKYNLYQNYPNPFNPGTTVQYDLPRSSHVTIKIYDELGRYVRTLIDKDMSAGLHKVEFIPSGLASGVYFYQLNASGYTSSNKMVYLK
jgi:mannosidase alpha-like ER degradation enhancer 2